MRLYRTNQRTETTQASHPAGTKRIGLGMAGLTAGLMLAGCGDYVTRLEPATVEYRSQESGGYGFGFTIYSTYGVGILAGQPAKYRLHLADKRLGWVEVPPEKCSVTLANGSTVIVKVTKKFGFPGIPLQVHEDCAQPDKSSCKVLCTVNE